MPKLKSLGGALVVLFLFGVRVHAQTPMDLEAAKRYFDDAKAASDADAGKLWGVRLYGPMMFADPQTRAVVANQADAEGTLR